METSNYLNISNAQILYELINGEYNNITEIMKCEYIHITDEEINILKSRLSSIKLLRNTINNILNNGKGQIKFKKIR